MTENRVWKIDTKENKAGQGEYCACVKLGWLQIGRSLEKMRGGDWRNHCEKEACEQC